MTEEIDDIINKIELEQEVAKKVEKRELEQKIIMNFGNYANYLEFTKKWCLICAAVSPSSRNADKLSRWNVRDARKHVRENVLMNKDPYAI